MQSGLQSGHAVQIERNFTQFVVFAEDSVLTALNKITANKSRLIFVVSEAGVLQGVLSDGDFRRWIAAGSGSTNTGPGSAARSASSAGATGSPAGSAFATRWRAAASAFGDTR